MPAQFKQDVSDALDAIGAARGSVLYRDGSLWRILEPGVPGQVLTTRGIADPPRWEDAGGGGRGGSFTGPRSEDWQIINTDMSGHLVDALGGGMMLQGNLTSSNQTIVISRPVDLDEDGVILGFRMHYIYSASAWWGCHMSRDAQGFGVGSQWNTISFTNGRTEYRTYTLSDAANAEGRSTEAHERRRDREWFVGFRKDGDNIVTMMGPDPAAMVDRQITPLSEFSDTPNTVQWWFRTSAGPGPWAWSHIFHFTPEPE